MLFAGKLNGKENGKIKKSLKKYRYKYTFGTQTFSESSIWYPNFRNVQFGTPIF